MEDIRDDRRFIRECAQQDKTWRMLSPEELMRVDRVCRAFDTLGIFRRLGLVNRRLVGQFYSVPFVLVYESFLRDYVEELRRSENRGATHYWELVMLYDKVKSIEVYHPGTRGDAEWPPTLWATDGLLSK